MAEELAAYKEYKTILGGVNKYRARGAEYHEEEYQVCRLLCGEVMEISSVLLAATISTLQVHWAHELRS